MIIAGLRNRYHLKITLIWRAYVRSCQCPLLPANASKRAMASSALPVREVSIFFNPISLIVAVLLSFKKSMHWPPQHMPMLCRTVGA